MDRSIAKDIPKIIRKAEAEARAVIEAENPEDARRILEENGVKLASKEEQLRQMEKIAEEYRKKYGSIDKLRERVEKEKDPYLQSVLLEWELIEETLKEG